MNVLLLGAGAREHALAWKISQSSILDALYIAPGNAGTRQHGKNVNISPTDFDAVKEFVIDKSPFEIDENLGEIEKKIVQILDQKIRPAVAKDGGDIKFKEFKNGVVMVQLQGSCSGCPSSTMTLKQGVQNLLCHYLPEVKEVVAV